MDADEGELLGESSSQPASHVKGGVRFLAKSVFKSSAVLHAVKGHLRSPTSLDVVLGKETSIELVEISESGILQSICDQTVFGLIKDLAVLPWKKKSELSEQGKDSLVVLSDSGKVTFLTFCNEMGRFFSLTHIQLSLPGNAINQLGSKLAVDPRGSFVAVSAYQDRFIVLSVSLSNANVVEKKIPYPAENVLDFVTEKYSSRNVVRGTIWSICFISESAHQPRQDGHHPVIAAVMNRKGAFNDLVLFGYNRIADTIVTLVQYSNPGSLALRIIEVPHMPGFAVLFRIGDALIMDLRDPSNPYCLYRTCLNFTQITEDFVEESSRYFDDNDEGILACALLELRDSGMDIANEYDPMSMDSGDQSPKSNIMCFYDWEPYHSTYSRLIFCLDTGKLSMLEIHSETDGVKVICRPVYHGLLCGALVWVQGGLIAAFAEMSVGTILKLEDGRLSCKSSIESIAPILSMSLVNCHDEKQDHIIAGCGVGFESSLIDIQNVVRVEKLLKTPSVYHGVTGTWVLKMKEADFYHSFLVLSFVEETRVLSVGPSFVDVSDAVGFKLNSCTVACGLLMDGLLVQIHRDGVQLCLPTSVAHPEGILLSSPICTSWSPGQIPISLGAIGRNLIILATSNPCFLLVLGVQLLSFAHYKIFEIQRVAMLSELSCIHIPAKITKPGTTGFLAEMNDTVLPTGVEFGKSFVVGTHKPSVEVLSFGSNRSVEVVAVADISINNASGIPVVGFIPEDVKLVFVDRCYILAGLRNGMLLRFEWPDTQCSTVQTAENSKAAVNLQLIATRRIGVSPVCLVPLEDSLDSDMIALSDRPWLLRAAKKSLSYTSFSVQSATHATAISFTDCPKGILFVVENSLLLVEMILNKRHNVLKFPLGGTPRKILYHNESKTVLVMRVRIPGDSCSSDVCQIDPLSGLSLARFKLEPGESAKCMDIVTVGKEQVLIVGTSQTSRHAIMASGEAERAKGRLIVISLDIHPQFTSHLPEMVGCATEQLSSSSLCSSPEEDGCEGVQHEDFETGKLRLVNGKSFSGVVLSVCAYSDNYFLASSGNNLFMFGFLNENPHRLRKFASTRTRFTITCLSASSTRIAVGDCRDGILIYHYDEERWKLDLLYCDPMQRLVADCFLIDQDTVIASDRRGSVSILSSPNDLEEKVSPECNLISSCSYYMGETVMTIGQGSFPYRLPLEDAFKYGGVKEIIPASGNIIVASTLMGSLMVFIPIKSEVYELLKAVESLLAVHPLTAPVLGNDHSEYRRRGSPPGVSTMLDGDLLAQFLDLNIIQQEAVISSLSPAGDETSSLLHPHVSIGEVVYLLEQIDYSLN